MNTSLTLIFHDPSIPLPVGTGDDEPKMPFLLMDAVQLGLTYPDFDEIVPMSYVPWYLEESINWGVHIVAKGNE